MSAANDREQRQSIIDALKSHGLDASAAPAMQPDHPPVIDAYAALQTRAGADQDAPTQIDSAADEYRQSLLAIGRLDYGITRIGEYGPNQFPHLRVIFGDQHQRFPRALRG